VSRFRVAHLDELERFEGDFDTIPVRIPLGIGSFGINAYASSEAGGHLIEEHDELGTGSGGHEELYIVLRGHARFVVDGEEVDGPAGTFLFIPEQAVRRSATAAEAETFVLVVAGKAGEAFRPSPWESWLEALPLYTAKDYEGAAAVLARALDEHPDHPNALYNLACCEALAGHREQALAHIRRSAEQDPRVVEWASRDSDLDSIRDDPGFPTAES
jgi:tetratricopeptide (TPR) repeat protein